MTVLFFSIIVGCSKSGTSNTPDPINPVGINCNGVDSKFSTVIAPIIAGACATSGCHASSNFNGPGALTNFTEIKAAASTIRSSVEAGRMPKNSSLTAAQKLAISCWVESGTLNN